MVAGNVQAAALLYSVVPVYPALAKQTGVEGLVRLSVVIGRDGMVNDVRLLSGQPLLVQAAMDSVRQRTYKPTLLNGEPVEVETTVDVNFKIN